MLSERLIVERRCAMEIVVLFPLIKDDSAELTSVSDSASRADVAGRDVSTFVVLWPVQGQSVPSSRIKISGFLSSARAIAIRCFWPPDSCVPRAPTDVSRPLGRVEMNC